MGHSLPKVVNNEEISLNDVKYSYYPKSRKKVRKFALKGINLKINAKDEFIGIVGHTGSGKSTIVQVLNALIRPTEGSVDILGSHVEAKNKILLKPIRRKVGLCFQFPEYQLFEETCLKDIMYGPKNFGFTNPEESARQAVKEIEFDETLLSESPFALSGGQMRKVALAGILACQPEVLIFDEPTVGLDPASQEDLIRLLQKLHEEHHTIIMITHNMDVMAQLCNRVIVMKSGNVEYDGSKDDLFRDSSICEKYDIDYPRSIKIMKSLKDKLDLKDLDIYQYSLEDCQKELLRVLGEEHE